MTIMNSENVVDSEMKAVLEKLRAKLPSMLPNDPWRRNKNYNPDGIGVERVITDDMTPAQQINALVKAEKKTRVKKESGAESVSVIAERLIKSGITDYEELKRAVKTERPDANHGTIRKNSKDALRKAGLIA